MTPAKVRLEGEWDDGGTKKGIDSLGKEFEDLKRQVEALTGVPAESYFSDLDRAIGQLARSAKKTETLEIARKAFENLSPAEREASIAALEFAESQERAARETADTENTIKNSGMGWTELKSKIDVAAMAFEKVIQSAKKVYEFGKAGAELEYTGEKFDRLAKSIGTTADALMTDLRNATKGTLSDAELMASAGDMMSLGLAKTHDEAVRLSAVASGLGMDMNQLVLTLTNQTTMRFDALGVSVDGFDDKVAALKKTGLDTNKAFTEAFLQQAEEQLAKVGNKADENIGGFMKLESAVKNLGDVAKLQAAPALGALADQLANVLNLSVQSQGTLANVTGGYGRAAYAMQKAQRAMLYNADGARYTALAQAYLAENTDKLTGTIVNDNTELRYMKGHLDDAASRARNMAQASIDLSTAIEGLQAAQSEWKEGAGGDIASMLDENTIGSQRYEEALAAIDRVNGTNLLSAEKLNDAQAELVKQYQNGTMSIDEFEQGLTDINDAFMPLDESIKNSTELMQGLIEKMESFGGTVYTAVARVVIENALEGSTGGGNSNGVTPTNNLPTGLTDYTNYGNNSGGATPARNGLNDFVVPPGYSEPNKPYFIATSSNEHVTVTPAGSSGVSGNTTLYATFNIYDVTNAEGLATEAYRLLSDKLRNSSRSGAALAGRT